MSRPDTLLIAVDGGGTGCRVAVGTAKDGVLAETRGGSANISTNFDDTVDNITKAVSQAIAAAGLSDADLGTSTAHLGLAGADLETIQQRAQQALPYGTCRVSGDRQTTVAGVLGDADGYVVALGTGTIIARQHGGKVRTVGGWGFQLSDQASGAWLGRSLLTRVLMVDDGIVPTSPLARTVSDSLGGLQGVFAFSNRAVPRDYAEFAPDVFKSGAQGDAIAQEILREGAAFIEKGLSALGFIPGDVLSLAGGVGPHFEPYLSAEFTQSLRAPRGNALQGAFTLARQLAAQG
ncbi:BadF/BadG/BcrA/BcrD ATPase family protein [Sulfitobacter aestuariivivens]|uniref:ATPase n=1 Tax=Sulfitobacter aestuariivivens TaxID=2766981 RepID=A0A927HDT0_9RHOB|nr:BadF/BadG/BcrA/BcrD ATPase family protein [Sulfitobacter aestuariivivens]MBD3664042.1 ATPase [Sulfitobacter aestuariivivens]